jgi:hypothetical protein
MLDDESQGPEVGIGDGYGFGYDYTPLADRYEGVPQVSYKVRSPSDFGSDQMG